MRRGRLIATTATAVAATLVAGACGPALVPSAEAAEFDTYPACDALLERIHDTAGAHVGAYGFEDDPVMTEDYGPVPDVMPSPTRSAPSLDMQAPAESRAASPPATTSAPEAATAPDAAAPASGTNVQEAGVDEDDTVKAGPGRILVLEDAVLRYVDVTGESPRLRGTLTLGFPATGLLVEGDHVLAVGSDSSGDAGSPRVVVTEVDVSEPDALHAGATVRVDGTLTAARSREGVARLVVESEPDLSFVSPGRGRRGVDHAADTNKAVVGSSTLEDWLPQVDGGPGLDCTKVMVPRNFAGSGMLTVMTLDLAGPLKVRDATALMARGEIVYDSGSTMYVAMPSSTRDGTTDVHAFDVSGSDPAVYMATGRVSGAVEDRWAMSESEGVLRVVTTGGGLGGPSSSSLVTLRREGASLGEAGRVDGIGRGEQVKAVRFVGALGYVVTFKRTDPLWVLDLHDAEHPRVSGELHVPGYSAYLHPIGDGTLVGVGQDADEATGRPLGLKVSLYDVSDPSRPATAAEWHAAPGTSSPAEEDPHAFLWWAPTGTVAIPIQTVATWSGPDVPASEPWGAATYSGEPTVVLHAGSASLVETGRLDCAGSAPAGYTPPRDGRRSVVVGESIYTVCSGGVAAFRLDGLAPTGQATWG